jgi:sulfur carrier protein
MGVRLMNIILNGKKTELEKSVTLIELLESKGIEPERVIVEYNFDILMRDDWINTVLKEDDNVEVLKFVGGG